MRSQALRIQKELKKEEIEIEEEGVRVVVSGDQRLKLLEVDGTADRRIPEVINKAIKKSQKAAARKLQEMSGGLGGILKGMRT